MIIPLTAQRKQNIIQRCCLAPKLLDASLAKHGFGVLSIVMDLVRLLEKPLLTQEQCELILRHDVLETITSDVPWIVKNASDKAVAAWDTIENEVLENMEDCELSEALSKYTDCSIRKTLGEELFLLFKIADMGDLVFYTREETSVGNKSREILEIRENALKALNVYISELNNEEEKDEVGNYFGLIFLEGVWLHDN